MMYMDQIEFMYRKYTDLRGFVRGVQWIRTFDLYGVYQNLYMRFIRIYTLGLYGSMWIDIQDLYRILRPST